MTAITEAEAFATNVIASAFTLVDPTPLLQTVDETLRSWMEADEAAAMEKVIIAYSIIGDVLAHVNAQVGSHDGS